MKNWQQHLRDTARHDFLKSALEPVLHDKETEKIFSQMAYEHLQGKVPDLLKPEHRLGFEVVHANDEGNRIAGMFAFRIGEKIYYVPCFFIQGKIVGVESILDKDEEQFKPLTKRQVSYIIKNKDSDDGDGGVPREEVGRHVNDSGLERIANPPGKHASGVSPHDLDRLPQIDFAGAFKLAVRLADEATDKKLSNVMEEYVRDTGDLSVSEELTKAACENWDLADAIAKHIPQSSLLPEGDDVMQKIASRQAALTKKAAAAPAPEPLVKLRRDPYNPVTKSAETSTSYAFPDGITLITDKRDAESTATVLENPEECFTTLSDEGDYKLLCCDYTTKPALVINRGKGVEIGDEFDSYPSAFSEFDYEDPATREVIVLMKEGGEVCEIVTRVTSDRPIYCSDEEVSDDERIKPTPLEELKTGKNYVITDGKGAHTCVKIRSKKDGDEDSPTRYMVVNTSPPRKDITKSELDDSYLHEKTMTIHEDHEDANLKEGLIGGCCKAYEVDCMVNDSELVRSITNELLKESFEHATTHSFSVEAERDGVGGYMYTVRDADEPWTERGSPIKTAAVLITAFNVSAKDAGAIMKSAEENVLRPVEFFTVDNSDAAKLVKSAGNRLKWLDEPFLQDTVNQTFGVTEALDYETYIPTVIDERGKIEEPRFWDAIDPSDGSEGNPRHADADSFHVKMADEHKHITEITLITASPANISQLAEDLDMPQVFEHGAIASLVKTFDSMRLIEKYTAKIDDCMDALGRILFLYYWKPEDFNEAFGSDDMETLEDTLISGYRTMGELCLDFKDKIDIPEGSPAAR